MNLLPKDLALDKDALKERVAEVEQTYAECQQRIDAAPTVERREAAMRYRDECSTYLTLLRDRLRGL
jgi:hypothetical protein